MNKQNGFTIIELIISIFILSVAVVGIFSAFSVMVILTSDASDRLTAGYLAQEGMEIVRNIRDTNWLNVDNPPVNGSTYFWTDGLGSCSVGCQADYKTMGTISSPLTTYDSSKYLYVDSNGFYDYDIAGKKTKFERKITINCFSDSSQSQNGDCSDPKNNVMKIIVQVSWDQKATILSHSAMASSCNSPGGPNNCIAVTATLYNWYESPANQSGS